MAANEGSMGSSNIANQTSNSAGDMNGSTKKPKTKIVKDAISKGKTLTGQKPDQIILNPVLEEKESHAVVIPGRFSPPSVGHEKMIKSGEETARKLGAQAHVFTSHSEGTARNPIPAVKKVEYVKKVAAPTTQVHSFSKEKPSLLHHLSDLHSNGVKHVTIVAGADRVKEYEDLANKYNGVESKHGHYNFKSIKVVSAGHRDPDAEGVEGMSGTKMRQLARSGDMEGFKKGLPKSLHPQAKEIAGHIQQFKEDLDREEILSFINEVNNTLFMVFAEGNIDRSNTHLRDWGTTSLTKIYKNDTPGQINLVNKINNKFNEAFKSTDREAIMRSGQDRKKTDLVPRSGQDRKSTTDAYRQQEIQKKIIDEDFEEFVNEQIKGWKNAGRDLEKWRQDKKDEARSFKLVSLKKDGSENKMHDATMHFDTEKQALDHHERLTRLNPNKKIRHNMYVDGKMVKTLGEQVIRSEEYQTPVTKKDFGKTDHYQALDDLDLNTANRNHTIDEYGYGPINPDDTKGSEKFWQDKADLWNTSVESAMSAKCGNCAAFNQSEQVLKKIFAGLGPEGEKINELADLGFCEIFEFKCAAARTCDAWLRGGPIKEEVNEDLRQWFKDKWVRMDTKGNIKGDCAREPGEGKPKCLPIAKARAMDKEDRAKAVRRKRREDPVADRPGKGGSPVNVRTEAANPAQQAAIAIALIKAGKKKGKMPKNEGLEETKSAPKGFHFTRDGKLRRGDADRDGDGGAMLRSDPLDKQRNKIPPVSEMHDMLNEKSKPSNPSLWSRAKSLARSKFDVYPSAYANGWAAKWYKKHGGTWRSE